MENYFELANSNVLFLLVLIPIIFALAQAICFGVLAIKRMRELGLGSQVKKVVVNSAIFSIVPSLPIVITLAALMVVLGQYLPWLRLSVIGSAMYESMCADMTIRGFGFAGLGDTSFPPQVFVSITWIMCSVALAWPICNLLGLRFYDKQLKKMQTSGGFIKRASIAMFIGLMCYFAVPRFLDFKNPTGIVVSIVSGGSVLLYDFIATKTKIKVLSDFAFPLAMITGMVSAIIYASIAGGV
ncbi:MAG: DUF5058 family protein [Spirochaetaceae bacterium]|jgi:hypothetical protein|nr:DUF5058 family protein [Spirochaetaceae bacterium]